MPLPYLVTASPSFKFAKCPFMILPGALPKPAGRVGLRGVCSRFPVPEREGGSSDVSRETSGLGYEESPLAEAMANQGVLLYGSW
jgi:hypothetical protein